MISHDSVTCIHTYTLIFFLIYTHTLIFFLNYVVQNSMSTSNTMTQFNYYIDSKLCLHNI
jgi:hypothetical protein